MNHRDTTIVMFFLMGGLILAVIVLIILCVVLFTRVRSDSNRYANKSSTSNQKLSKLKNLE